MRSSWTRPWIAAAAVLAAAAVVVRTRASTLLQVEEPVMEWLLDGTDTSIWDRAAIFGANWLIIVGTIVLAVVGFIFEKRAGIAVVVTTLFAFVLTRFIRSIVGRAAPQEGLDSSFPSPEIVQAGVFWGLVVMMLWWLGAPRLIWQIALELVVVIALVLSIRLLVAGEIWPSDAAGSAIVIALSLITAAAALEANPPGYFARRLAEKAGSPDTQGTIVAT